MFKHAIAHPSDIIRNNSVASEPRDGIASLTNPRKPILNIADQRGLMADSIAEVARETFADGAFEVSSKSSYRSMNGGSVHKIEIVIAEVKPIVFLGTELPLVRKSPVVSISADVEESPRFGLQVGGLLFVSTNANVQTCMLSMNQKIVSRARDLGVIAFIPDDEPRFELVNKI